MTTAFVLGNGVSRQGIDLVWLKNYGKIYGCNALYREFTPDVLVATDTPIAMSIQESGYAKSNRFYTRRPISGSGALMLMDPYRGYSSGPNAVAIAAGENTKVCMLGFDMGPTTNNLFNNVYADTEFYKTSAHPPTFTGNWTKQIIRICQDHPQITFVRVCGETTATIPDFDKISNLEHQKLENFLNSFVT